MPERIDAHHHLWRFRAAEYDWLTEPEYTVLRRDFLLPELQAAMAEAAIDGAIAVQARQTLEETRWLLELAAATIAGDARPLLRGVVGWAPLADAEFPQMLEELSANPLLRGLRHVVQGEPEGFLADAAFNQGVAALEGTGLGVRRAAAGRGEAVADAGGDGVRGSVSAAELCAGPTWASRAWQTA